MRCSCDITAKDIPYRGGSYDSSNMMIKRCMLCGRAVLRKNPRPKSLQTKIKILSLTRKKKIEDVPVVVTSIEELQQ
jgi:hypothetical protein